jgi:hypothetical protein
MPAMSAGVQLTHFASNEAELQSDEVGGNELCLCESVHVFAFLDREFGISVWGFDGLYLWYGVVHLQLFLRAFFLRLTLTLEPVAKAFFKLLGKLGVSLTER